MIARRARGRGRHAAPAARPVPRPRGGGSRTVSAILYGDRNQNAKLFTLITHAGLVGFILAAAITSRFGFETGILLPEGQALPVESIGVDRPGLGQEPGLHGAPRRGRALHGLHDRPRGLPRRAGDRPQGDPGERPARGGRLHVPPELLRAGGRPDDPRRRRAPPVGRAGPARRGERRAALRALHDPRARGGAGDAARRGCRRRGLARRRRLPGHGRGRAPAGRSSRRCSWGAPRPAGPTSSTRATCGSPSRRSPPIRASS